jgi:CRISPR-associated protein Cas6
MDDALHVDEDLFGTVGTAPAAPPAAVLVELAFELRCSGPALPAGHHPRLVAALDRACPGWADVPGSGVHELHLAAGGLLSRRTRLVARVARAALDRLAGPQGLAASPLDLGGDLTLTLHRPQARELLPWTTLYAHFVTLEVGLATPVGVDPVDPAAAAVAELAFMQAATRGLRALAIRGRVICGRRQQREGPWSLAGSGQALPTRLAGHSLMVDQLGAADAQRLLEHGLGLHRRLGCGLFVPHKSAAAVGTPPG